MMNRRELLKMTVVGASVFGIDKVLAPQRAFADPDPSPHSSPTALMISRDPEIYPFRIGETEAFVIHDGFLANPSIQPFFVPEADPIMLKKLLSDQFLPTDTVTLSINVLVLKRSEGIFLIDSGIGMGTIPTGGRLIRGLEILGIAPEKIAGVIITHAHTDHIRGILDADGKLLFPNAKVYISKTEADFWMSPDFSKTKLPEDLKKNQTATAQKCMKEVGGLLQKVSPGVLLPGLELISAPGHTPGHMIVKITFGEESLLHVADAVHLFALQFSHPEWTMAGDVDASLAIKTRKRIFEDAAIRRTRVFGYHLPFPGLGHIAKAGKDSYQWVPAPWIA